jgi:hypothetical protein
MYIYIYILYTHTNHRFDFCLVMISFLSTALHIASASLAQNPCIHAHIHTHTHRFDFSVVMISFLSIALDIASASLALSPTIFRVLRVLRIFRILRAFRIFKSAEGLQKLVRTLLRCVCVRVCVCGGGGRSLYRGERSLYRGGVPLSALSSARYRFLNSLAADLIHIHTYIHIHILYTQISECHRQPGALLLLLSSYIYIHIHITYTHPIHTQISECRGQPGRASLAAVLHCRNSCCGIVWEPVCGGRGLVR